VVVAGSVAGAFCGGDEMAGVGGLGGLIGAPGGCVIGRLGSGILLLGKTVMALLDGGHLLLVEEVLHLLLEVGRGGWLAAALVLGLAAAPVGDCRGGEVDVLVGGYALMISLMASSGGGGAFLTLDGVVVEEVGAVGVAVFLVVPLVERSWSL